MLALASLLVAPVADAKISSKGLPKFLHSEESALDGKGDRNGIGMFNRAVDGEKTKYVHVNGKVTAVSTTSITVDVRSKNEDETITTSPYTFAIDSTTKIIRKFKGSATIVEIAVGDKVKLWGTKLEGGVAKLIWDKSIWWGQIKGTITDLNATTKTFKLILKQKQTASGKTITVAATVKTHDGTKYWLGDVEKAFTDLANDQVVTVRGSWNSANKYFLANKVTITP